MASISSPFGAQPISDGTGVNRPVRIVNGIASGYGTNIFKNAPVRINPANGTLVAVTNPGGVPDALYGIFAGVEYTPLGGRPVVSPFWAAGTVVDPTYDFLVYYWPCWLPGTRIKVQADGPVAQALLGSSFNFSNLTAGSAATGLSQCTVAAASVVAGSQGQLTLTEFGLDVGDAIGDAFTNLICTVAYPQVGFVGKTSIG